MKFKKGDEIIVRGELVNWFEDRTSYEQVVLKVPVGDSAAVQLARSGFQNEMATAWEIAEKTQIAKAKAADELLSGCRIPQFIKDAILHAANNGESTVVFDTEDHQGLDWGDWSQYFKKLELLGYKWRPSQVKTSLFIVSWEQAIDEYLEGEV